MKDRRPLEQGFRFFGLGVFVVFIINIVWISVLIWAVIALVKHFT